MVWVQPLSQLNVRDPGAFQPASYHILGTRGEDTLWGCKRQQEKEDKGRCGLAHSSVLSDNFCHQEMFSCSKVDLQCKD